jgi:hypothetical protein
MNEGVKFSELKKYLLIAGGVGFIIGIIIVKKMLRKSAEKEYMRFYKD